MTWLDVLLQRWRMRAAVRELRSPARLLDIGTHDGLIFRLTGAGGVGIDPELPSMGQAPAGVRLVKGSFPSDLPETQGVLFDAVTALGDWCLSPRGGATAFVIVSEECCCW